MKFGVVVFPGSNCDHDTYYVLKEVYKLEVDYIWHKETTLSSYDCIILPGGFSYGDYMRSGAIARFSPVMQSVIKFAHQGGLVLGICNGFQILMEAGLLPGAMLRNKKLKFICQDVHIRVEDIHTPFTTLCRKGEVLRLPIAHKDGNYFADVPKMEELKKNNQIIFRYCTPDGALTEEANLNGSLDYVAGICNLERNVLGLMPHPERYAESILGNEDGKRIFDSIINYLSKEK
ncbi:MAG: phosphoribosylformylglycinamidine synthase subunit PurQ [Candidatus Aminicenantes bacterium]|nr:phosphoribosylformylglycinamidine synthase subunit PurQ [Candidatus Aminicenantes bacterium]MDH5715790.1 phosphoribosylformylglycinamidine synthase subunit PurQ [Candidatus Aminicenantes bacterium]